MGRLLGGPAVAENSNEKDDLPESSKLDLDAEQSKQTMQILSGLLGSKDIDTMYDSVRQVCVQRARRASRHGLSIVVLDSAGG